MSKFSFYRGHEKFYEVLDKEDPLNKPGRIIRVYNYSRHSGDEDLYVIGLEGELFNTRTGEKVIPEKVLSKKNAPDGWSVEGYSLFHLPEEQLKKFIDIDKE